MLLNLFSLLSGMLFALNIIFAIVIVFYERKNPAVTWAWLMVTLILPYVGFIIYLVIGLDSRKHRIFSEKAKKDEEFFLSFLSYENNKAFFSQDTLDRISAREVLDFDNANRLNDLVYMNFVSGKGALTGNNTVTIFHEGVSLFDSLLAEIEKAESFVHVQYYIFNKDETGKALIDVLTRKAAQGVEVRLFVDGMGCYLTPRSFYKPLEEAGGQVCIFLPPTFVRINFRNHRKICVIDGKVGYVGGVNIGDEYLGKVKRFGFWRDTHIKIEGEAVSQLQLRFVMDWNFSSPDKISLNKKYFPDFIAASDNNPQNKVKIQVVSSGPDTKHPSILYGYTKMVTEADKYIYLVTPYFVPDDSLFEALRIAALSGIDVRIIIPAKPDHPFVYWASLSYMGELLSAGVRCYKYEKGFVHSKLLIIDGVVSSVGTANLDVRSFKLNFETNAFIYNENITKQFEEQYYKDIEDCTEITLEIYKGRSTMTKIKESISRLLSPML